ncbi:MAG: glutamate-1-semialdehyde 2,1-aminomutase [Candidatus Eisenbacteria bacterium]|nr:glutamate-1-semialdehyde 2,1-aminomutase [Candidatus Eisenbacteria bacterium]
MNDPNRAPDHLRHAGPRSQALLARAKAMIPGGVNSPVRAFRAVGGNPLFMERGSGCRITDVDGRSYIDYVGSWGPLLFGHADPEVIAAVRAAAEMGTSFGAPTAGEVELAERIIQLVPSVQKVRLVNSGTEATMSALRVARGATGRDKVIKFEGCYHGHGDAFLIKAGSGAATFGVPDSPGVPAGTAADTLIASYNDPDAVDALFDRYAQEIAAVIVEPVVGNMGCVPPQNDFLRKLRASCDREGALLIFDEVMTGFRLAQGGAQELYGITPDLTTMGKVVGGGLPLAAYGGRADVMSQVAPEGPVYQAGTLSGNPIATAAGNAMLAKIVATRDLYPKLERLGRRLSSGLDEIAREPKMAERMQAVNGAMSQTRVGSFVTLFFGAGPMRNWDDVKQCSTERFGRYFRGMLARGIYLAPSQFETGFLSYAHSDAEIDLTLEAAREALFEAFEV